MTSGGHEVDVGGGEVRSTNVLDFIVECSTIKDDSRHSEIASTGKKLALRLSVHLYNS